MSGLRSARQSARRLGVPLALSFFTTFCLAPFAQAASLRPNRAAGRVRTLTPGELRAIRGAQSGCSGQNSPTVSLDGASYDWQATVGGANTASGNHATDLPLVGWTARGGLPVSFVLHHYSKSPDNGVLGYKWRHSYQITLAVDTMNSTVTVTWGDGRAIRYSQNVNGSFSPPAGIHDTLTSGSGYYDVTTKDQVKYHFTRPNSNGWVCTSITDANANALTLAYNTSDQLTSVTDPTSRALSISYSSGKISSITDPQSRSWSFTYTSGNLTQVTWPALGGNTYSDQFSYNTNHCITTHTDRRSNNWTANYNTNDTVAWVKDPLLNQTSFSYGFIGTTITDPNGKQTVHQYDSSGRLSQIDDPLSNSEAYTWDSDNNKTEVTDKRGKVWQFGFDSAGNVTSRTDPLSHTTYITYSSKNRPLTVTTPLGHQVVNTYDSTLNWRLTQTQLKSSGGTVLGTTSFGYNSYGLMTSKTDSNSRQTTYGYSTNGDLTSLTTPNSRVWGWGYNSLGVKNSRTDALNRTTSYTLDGWDRVTTTTFPNSSTHTFSFDANSNLTGWTDGQGTWSRTYDTANRLTNESLNSSTRFSYSYDATNKKGLLSSLTDAASRTFTYSYTDRQEVSSVVETDGSNTYTISYTYDPAGNETNVSNPNGTTVTRVFDDSGRLSSVTNKNSGNTTLSSFSYSYSADDQRTGVTEADSSTVSWGYDGAHRLTSETRTGTNAYSKTYTLDGVGNRTSQSVGGTSTTLSYSTDDEITGTSGGFSNSYSYNANGEQTGRTLAGTSSTLAFDYDGQLTSITTGGATVSFAYDGLGRRITRTAGGTTTQFLSSGSRIYLEAVGGTVTAKYGYGNALYRKDSEYPLFDGQGSERTVTNGSQTVTGTLNQDSFGVTAGSTGSSSSPYMYAATSGYRNDGDSGLMHVGARYYDAQVGRWISRDTDLTEHPYLYCEADPVNLLDPDGHSGKPWWDKLWDFLKTPVIGPSPTLNEKNRRSTIRRGNLPRAGTAPPPDASKLPRPGPGKGKGGGSAFGSFSSVDAYAKHDPVDFVSILGDIWGQ
jgi:RHS repeat-associated protein